MGESEAVGLRCFDGGAMHYSRAASANGLAALLVRSIELCGAYEFVLSSLPEQIDWSTRTLLRRHNQDQFILVQLLVCRIQTLDATGLILPSQLGDEIHGLDKLYQCPDAETALSEIANIHKSLAERATLLVEIIAALGHAEDAALIRRHVVHRNRTAGASIERAVDLSAPCK